MILTTDLFSGSQSTWSSPVGLASRTNAITLYLAGNFDQKQELLQKFGKHKTEKGCIYIKRIEDTDKDILRKMVRNPIEYSKQRNVRMQKKDLEKRNGCLLPKPASPDHGLRAEIDGFMCFIS